MSQSRKAKEFTALHVKGMPVVLYNAWDAGSAKAIVDAGAKAIATSSWSVAAAQGFEDGEKLPPAFAEQIVRTDRGHRRRAGCATGAASRRRDGLRGCGSGLPLTPRQS